MNSTLRPLILAAIAAALIAAFAAPALPRGAHPNKANAGSSTDTPEINSGRDALRHIVQEQCLVHWTDKHDPAPCERVYISDSNVDNSGYAVLADRKGGAHYLLIPTHTMGFV